MLFRSRRATHPFDGALIVTGHGLDGQTAFAALGRTLDAADRLVGGAGRGLAARILIIVRTTTSLAAGARSLAGGALDFRRRGRGVRSAATRRPRAAGTIGRTPGSRTRRQRRITDGFAARTRAITLLRPITLRAVGARATIGRGLRAVAVARRPLEAATVGARRALTEIGVLEAARCALGTIGRRRGAIVATLTRGFIGAGLA